jgi:hypothetical protein
LAAEAEARRGLIPPPEPPEPPAPVRQKLVLSFEAGLVSSTWMWSMCPWVGSALRLPPLQAL